ncbi:MAG: fructosamine kinase family protein [Eubacterium sp.]|nr:fructosamine kinase family protein [Eubacterium sp.]
MSKEIPEYNSVLECLQDRYGSLITVTGKSYVGGGDINEASQLLMSNGDKVFMKSNSVRNADFFRAEALGLSAIDATGAIRTPELIGRGIDKSGQRAFLIMEYIGGSKRVADFWETFGHELAAMHLAKTTEFTTGYSGNPDESGRFGFIEDNYIGATKQINSLRDMWIDFYRECRLMPQFKMADRYFDGGFRSKIDRLLERLSDYIEEPTRPSLLHGDLWSGNYIIGNDQKAWLIDPAVYVGHAEADLAMTELFGRFPERFYSAYSEVNPISPDYKDRRDLYNLYHLTNHLNLFGPAYLSAVVETVRYYAG